MTPGDSVVPPPGGTPPGWHPDPWGLEAWRWWEGAAWTGYTSTPSTPPPAGFGADRGPQAPPQYPQYPQYAQYQGAARGPVAPYMFALEHRSVPWAKRVAGAYVVLQGVALLSVWSQSGRMRSLFDIVRSAARSGTNLSQNQQFIDWNSQNYGHFSLLQLLGLIEIPMAILLLVWQYRAAKTAQLLGLPASVVPGLGIGSWFIPVVNLWFPYRSMRDCLPPGDPGRRTVLRMWLCYLATYAVSIATFVVILVGSPVGFILAGVQLTLALAVSLLAIEVVQSISDAHQRILFPDRSG